MRLLTLVLLPILFASASLAHEGHGPAVDAITVESIIAGGPAAAAGLKAGDTFLRLDGQEVGDLDELRAVMDSHQPGDTVSLEVERAGEPVALQLTFGAREDGGVSVGVSLQVPMPAGEAEGEPTEGTQQCLSWISETYRIEPLLDELGLDMAPEYEALQACVMRDTQRMPTIDAVRYCDNVFKVHCSAVDLMTEIGETLVERCSDALSKDNLTTEQSEAWKTCGEQKVFDRYSLKGDATDAGACKTVLEECGVGAAGSSE